MMRRAALLAVAVTAVLATGCRTGIVMWSACTAGSDPTGTDGAYAMVCSDGTWVPVMTVDEFVRASRGEPNVKIAQLPERPTTTTTSTTTTTTTTTTSTTAPPAVPYVQVSYTVGTLPFCSVHVTLTGGAPATAYSVALKHTSALGTNPQSPWTYQVTTDQSGAAHLTPFTYSSSGPEFASFWATVDGVDSPVEPVSCT